MHTRRLIPTKGYESGARVNSGDTGNGPALDEKYYRTNPHATEMAQLAIAAQAYMREKPGTSFDDALDALAPENTP